jgi:hypothetical protein
MTPKKDDKPSMFKSLLDQARSKNEELEEIKETTPTESEPEAIETRKPGRPRGRRSNPDYTKLCALVPMDLLLEVQSILLQQRRNKVKQRAKDVSALVENLLTEWVAKNKEN